MSVSYYDASTGELKPLAGTPTEVLNAKQNKELDTPLSVAGATQTTVESALSAINTLAASKQDAIQYSTMPTASAVNVGQIVQYTGADTQSYKNGFFYKCVEDSGNYSWVQIDFGGSGGATSLSELEDVNISEPSDGQIMLYDSENHEWVNDDLGDAAFKDTTNAVTSGSTALVESGAVKSAIDAAVVSAYKAGGAKTCAELTSALLVAANEGMVYNMSDTGTTTADFIEGAGKEIGIGSDVAVIKVGNAYKFNLLPGIIDTSNFVQKSQTAGLLKNDGTVDQTSYIDGSGISSPTDGQFLVYNGTAGKWKNTTVPFAENNGF